MKKLLFVLFALLLVSTPLLTHAAGATTSGILPLVQCGNSTGNYTTACTLNDLFAMLFRIYKFAVYFIAIPLAALLVVIGGILILLSGINANWFATGKTILWNTGIALAIILTSFIIIAAVLRAIGYVAVWNVF